MAAHPSERLHEKSHGESFLAIAQRHLKPNHSPILSGMPNAEILTFDDGKINACEYEETDSYQVTEMFLNNRKQLLKRLLGSE